MADVKNKVAENIEGVFYVENEFITCQKCIDEAPNNFKMNDNGSSVFVFKQPENDTEKKNCEEVMDSCSAEAIGNDG
ncbi:ferredoxin [Methanococcoides burtonii]|uniref:Ferredoxin n=1 Tax=Methanococcoides burtonii (strain DSM 6242 / NBRC 107633 / OCM 468 / ACE-M) TaxID=259564 RepID=Q12TP9_METBU|nr:ferredoxin [Methanococcoides burtonii]ABE53177.1 Ferredoxin [Methanococcoides burtonii DSM 6242]